jgi:hypothetical protein
VLKTCLFLTGLPLLFALGLLFFLGFEQSSGSQPEPFPFPPAITVEPFIPITPYEFQVTPTGPPLLESVQMTATAIIRAATETAQGFLATPTPTFGSPTALPEFGATPTPTPT